MNTEKESKINLLLQKQPAGTVFLSSWLEKQGYSNDLQKSYRRNGWFDSIGTGAMIRRGDTVNWLGALYSLQQYTGLNIHIGGQSALGMQGKAHYLEINPQKVDLFAPQRTKFPTWFKNYNWNIKLELHNTNFLPIDLGLAQIEEKNFSVKISGPARAILEHLYLASNSADLVECYQIMESLNTLRPSVAQELLEKCNSIKVIRSFLFLAEKTGHPWAKYLELDKINLGKGKRSLAKNGVYVPKYQITIPEELAI